MLMKKTRWLICITLISIISALTGCEFLSGFVPPVPSDVTATIDEFPDRVRVFWAPVPQAGGYEIWRSESEVGDYTFLARTGYASYDDVSVVPARDYWYKVKSCNRFGCSNFSEPVRGRAKAENIPSSPSGLRASQGTYADHITVEWDAVSGAVYYEIYRSQTSSSRYVLLGTVEKTRYDDYGVVPGRTYWYRVRTCSEEACSALSQPVSGYAGIVGLPAPINVTATDGEYPDKIVVNWDPVEGATNYIVYRAASEDGDYLPIADVENTRYEDANVVAGTTYWYRVRACSPEACSALSAADEGSAGEKGPPRPPE